jgi:hypothetical protein
VPRSVDRLGDLHDTMAHTIQKVEAGAQCYHKQANRQQIWKIEAI